MSDYIKREDAIKWATDFIEGVEEEDDICIVDPGGWESVHDYCEEAITCMIPSADVVEVVRCGNCKYWQNYNDVMVCGLTNAMMSVSDYCSYGERAEA